MRVVPIGLAGFVFMSPATALGPTPAGYDLKCEGMSSLLDDASAEMPASPFTMTLHVDLAHNSFCQNNCQTQEKISKVLASNIVFRAVNAPWPNRLWVADTGQFSYTWADMHDEKPSVHSAQGTCVKVVGSAESAVEVRSKASMPSAKLTVATQSQKPANQPRPEELSATEITALIDIQNHRPVPASMHTKLYERGLVHLENEIWVLTERGEAIITGDRR